MLRKMMAIAQGLMMLVIMFITTVLPLLAVCVGVVLLLFNEPETFAMLALYVIALFAVIAGAGFVLTNKTTGPFAQVVACILVAVVLVKACSVYSGKSGDCIPSRYIDCD
jgi:peptidoglycan/LPS O-acetylase OafA/YrhL